MIGVAPGQKYGLGRGLTWKGQSDYIPLGPQVKKSSGKSGTGYLVL